MTPWSHLFLFSFLIYWLDSPWSLSTKYSPGSDFEWPDCPLAASPCHSPLFLIVTDLTVLWLSPSAPPLWFWFWLTWLSLGWLPLPLPSCLVLQLLGHLIQFVLELPHLLALWPAFYRRLVSVFGQFPKEQKSQFYKMYHLKLCAIKTYKYTWPMLSRKILYWTNTYLTKGFCNLYVNSKWCTCMNLTIDYDISFHQKNPTLQCWYFLQVNIKSSSYTGN